jgi:sulfite reductase (NADPH) flavoprotein alpha-component
VAYQKSGLLTKLDLAWSRDQAHKIYVQDLMRQNAQTLYDWVVNRGACFYVCGDAKRMAKDVESAFVDILKNGGAFNDDASVTAYLAEIKKIRRYMRDVY